MINLESQAMEASRVERSHGNMSYSLAGDSSKYILKLDLAWLLRLVAMEPMNS
jgi:hypothetical protein